MLILYSFHIGTSLQGSLYCFLNNSIFQNDFFGSELTPSYTILLSKYVGINIKPCEITTKKCNSANNFLKNCKKERLLLSQKAFLGVERRKNLAVRNKTWYCIYGAFTEAPGRCTTAGGWLTPPERGWSYANYDYFSCIYIHDHDNRKKQPPTLCQVTAVDAFALPLMNLRS